MAGQANLA
jgi:hypothetical protein